MILAQDFAFFRREQVNTILLFTCLKALVFCGILEWNYKVSRIGGQNRQALKMNVNDA